MQVITPVHFDLEKFLQDGFDDADEKDELDDFSEIIAQFIIRNFDSIVDGILDETITELKRLIDTRVSEDKFISEVK